MGGGERERDGANGVHEANELSWRSVLMLPARWHESYATQHTHTLANRATQSLSSALGFSHEAGRSKLTVLRTEEAASDEGGDRGGEIERRKQRRRVVDFA